MHACEAIHAYWFGTVSLRDPPVPGREDWWWVQDEAIDHEIAHAFEPDVRSAATGSLADWELAPDSSLALVILLDQFSRSIWRRSARAFENDAAALAVAKRAIRGGYDGRAHPLKRLFFYMPFVHAESLPEQNRAVAMVTELRDTAGAELRPTLDVNLDYARKHRAVIEKFRNYILGRPAPTGWDRGWAVTNPSLRLALGGLLGLAAIGGRGLHGLAQGFFQRQGGQREGFLVGGLTRLIWLEPLLAHGRFNR